MRSFLKCWRTTNQYLLFPSLCRREDFLGDNGGHASWVKRKAMNSFICSVDRPFSFMGRINEDVNTYTNLGRCGELFMTIGAVQLGQKQTQKNSGGMTELYLDSGTYVKSFTPSCMRRRA